MFKGLFPSLSFYGGKLVTCEKVAKNSVHLDLGSYVVFNLENSQEIADKQTSSLYNPQEASMTLKLCNYLRKAKSSASMSIGIITPYQRQVQYLKDLFFKNNLGHIEIDTVDAYQGREKDIVIFSCVRAKNFHKNIGFLTNKQRLNVSLTRAKHGQYIICHADSLRVNKDWKNCIENAKQRNRIRNVFNESSFVF